jgi:16S rRNA (adenine1518-N6/adenine1519-N6)-dimethyltransferase
MAFPSPSKIGELLDELGVSPSKRFGQNFLSDYKTVQKIVKLLDLKQGEKVIEIGPGLGSMTVNALDVGIELICIEIDTNLCHRLEYTINDECEVQYPNFSIVNEDALKIKVLNCNFKKLFSNLPYNVATPIIIEYFKKFDYIDEGVFMVQTEIADRLNANPNDKLYAASSVKAQHLLAIEKVYNVSRKVFIPQPRVDSVIIKCNRKRIKDEYTEPFFDFVETCFKHRRKTITNNLKLDYGLDKILYMLNKVGYGPSVRPQEISVDNFYLLYSLLENEE